jgi:hypothetical protein
MRGRHDIQHNDTQHNGTRHNGLICDIQIKLCISEIRPYVNAVMLSVIMLRGAII